MCNEFYDTFYGHSEPLDSKWLGDIHKNTVLSVRVSDFY